MKVKKRLSVDEAVAAASKVKAAELCCADSSMRFKVDHTANGPMFAGHKLDPVTAAVFKEQHKYRKFSDPTNAGVKA